MECIKTLIVDDERRNRELLITLIDDFLPDVAVVDDVNSIENAFKAIEIHNPDLLLLDIELGKNSGFELLEQIKKDNIQVIFTTAHEKYALNAFKVGATDYLLKPIDLESLKKAIDKARKQKMAFASLNGPQNEETLLINSSQPTGSSYKVAIPTQEGYEVVKPNHIMYCVAEGAYTKCYLKNERCLVVSRNLKYFEHLLQTYDFFYRIHSSSIINIKYLKKLVKTGGGHVIMNDGMELKLSKSKKDGLLKTLNLI